MKSRQILLGRVFRNGRQLLGCLFVMLVAAATAVAGSDSYEYDNAGRLTKVTLGDGTVISYTLDPAGNRTSVQTAIPAAPPATLTVPTSSTTGSYSISWTASPTSGVTGYQLWESTDSTFAAQNLAWNGMSPASITGKGNGTYFYRVQACVSTLCGAYQIGSNSIAVTPPPGAPASITAPTTNFTGAYSISWTAPTTGTVTRYEVDEATNPAFTSPLNIFNANGTSTSVSGRLSATTYYYRVRACNGAACGSYTASSGTAVTLLPAAPASLTNPAGDPDGNYNVSWASVSGPVSAYEVYEANNAAFTGAALVYNSTGTVVPLTGRVTGTYYYRVRACNTAGCSGYTAGTGPTTVAVPPGAPASISAPATNFTGAYSISWTAPTTGAVTGYEVDEATNPAFTSPVNIFNANGISTSVSGRLTATTYYYRVRACNGPGNCGPYTASGGTAVTLPPPAPASITNPANDTDGNYSVSWASVSGPLSAFEVYEASNAAFTGAALVYNSTGTSVPLTGRANGAYYYRVRACNAAGCGGYATGSGPTTVALPPGAPASISAPATNFTGAYSISWTAPTTGAVTGYEVDEATNPAFTSPLNIFSANGTSTSVSGRLTATTYYYRVRACNGAGNCGPYTASGGTAVTLPPPAPASITNPANDTDGSYDVTWATVTGPLSAFEVYEANNPAFTGAALVYNSTGTSVPLTGRANGTYYYRVRACNAGGCGGYATGSGPTTVALPPGAPASISVPGSAFSGSYAISWTAPTVGNVTGYELYESTDASFTSPALVYNSTGLSTTLSNSNVTLYYRVRACNGAGNCGPYTTGAAPIVVSPAMSAGITVPISSTGSVSLSWSAVSGVTGYEVYEATNASFSGASLIYSSTGTSTSLTRANGTYYYRVRACNGASNCGDYRAGANPHIVVIQPPSISVPPNSPDGVYTVSWTSPGGTFDRYELYKSTDAGFSGEALAYSGTGTSQGFSGGLGGIYYYRVRICTSSVCSALTVAANPHVVAYPPASGPISITETPNFDSDGTYTIFWGTAGASNEYYEFYEANNPSFSGAALVYQGTTQNFTLTGRGEGVYYYRVRACNQFPTSCGPYTTRNNAMTVTFPPGPVTSFTVPGTSAGSHTLSWGAPANHYDGFELQESLSSSFASVTNINPGNNLSITLTGRATGTYYYRIRSTYSASGNSSAWVEGANPTVVNTPPPIPNVPDGISVPAGNGRNYAVTWWAPLPGGAAVNHYTLKEDQTYPSTGTITTNEGLNLSKSYSKPNAQSQWFYSVRACATADESACSGYTGTVFKQVCPTTGCQ